MKIANAHMTKNHLMQVMQGNLKRRLGFVLFCLVIAALVASPVDSLSLQFLAGIVAIAIATYSAERWGRSESATDNGSSEFSSGHLRSLLVAGFVSTLVNAAVQIGAWRGQHVALNPAIATWYSIMLCLASPMPLSPLRTLFSRFRYPHRLLLIVFTTIASIWVRRYGLLVPAFFMLLDLTSPVEEGLDEELWIVHSISGLAIGCSVGLILSAYCPK